MKIIYHDQQIVIIAKPGGLLSVPGRGAEKKNCVVSRLREQFPDMPQQPAVHRLDMSTSGLMVLARTKESHRQLSRQFELRQVEKVYEAVVEGDVKQDQGEIQLAFRLDITNRPLQIYDPDKGKLGITFWQKKGNHPLGTRLLFFPTTGRTHQLRVHAAHPLGLGSPIVGDFLYGSGNDGDKLFLHASELSFTHPKTNRQMYFFSQTPF